MKYIKTLSVLSIFLLVLSCNENDNEQSNEPSTIEIRDYMFQFPSEFELVEEQGIDSYVGKIVGSGISMNFDYGWYTSPVNNLPINEYLVSEDEINGHFRQIVKPINAELNYTRIHLYKVSDFEEEPFGYNSLTISTNNLTVSQQEMIISVFNSVEIFE